MSAAVLLRAGTSLLHSGFELARVVDNELKLCPLSLFWACSLTGKFETSKMTYKCLAKLRFEKNPAMSLQYSMSPTLDPGPRIRAQARSGSIPAWQ